MVNVVCVGFLQLVRGCHVDVISVATGLFILINLHSIKSPHQFCSPTPCKTPGLQSIVMTIRLVETAKEGESEENQHGSHGGVVPPGLIRTSEEKYDDQQARYSACIYYHLPASDKAERSN